MKNKTYLKIIVDFSMLILMLMEYSKMYTGVFLHEIFGTTLLVLFITHNILNINFYLKIFEGKYSLLRLITIIIDILFLLCMCFTIALGIPISERVFRFMNLNGNITIRKLHTLFGYWGLILLSIHFGLHFKLIFAKLKRRIQNMKLIKVLLYLVEVTIIIVGLKKIFDLQLWLYLIGKSSFAIPSGNVLLSFVNNFMIVASLGFITYNIEKLQLKIFMIFRIRNLEDTKRI